jgi:hypothetical protein
LSISLIQIVLVDAFGGIDIYENTEGFDINGPCLDMADGGYAVAGRKWRFVVKHYGDDKTVRILP